MKESRARCRWHATLAVAATFWAAGTSAQPSPTTEEITVVAPSPLAGTSVSRDSVPVQTQVLTETDIAREGAPDVLQALDEGIAGLNLDSASGNPFQPSLFYNGFEVSPLQGTPQGIAVYLNGVRFNQPFGDTVNWDLIPDVAIRRLTVEDSNPVFGLNALGGSFNVGLKDGFLFHGGQLSLSGGAFGTVRGDFQFGLQSGNQALYAAGSALHQDGWRDLQSTNIQNLYADYGLRSDKGEAHVSLLAANAGINGPGTAPVELLAVDSAAQFTAPNAIFNRAIQAAFRGSLALNDTLSLQGNAYYGYFQQRVANGNAANDFPCDDGSGLLCQAVGVPATTRGGIPIRAFLGGNPFAYSELDTQTTNTSSYGVSGQLVRNADVMGLRNHLVAGASFDGAATAFSATAFVGGITPVTRVFLGPGVTIDEPGTSVPVRVAITDAYAGIFGSDTLNLTDALAATISGRLNVAEIDLRDQGGGDLSGHHAYTRFNPFAGATYRFAPWLTAYASYAEANRAPTPAELSCAGPQNSCSLANFFVGDPDLKQVVAHTIEAGLRGSMALPGRSVLRYQAGLFRADLDDDIGFINSVALNRAFFANVGRTRREGVSLHADYKGPWATAYADYSYVKATFETGYIEPGGNNPATDANGNLTVRPGDTLPGVPRNVVKAGIDVEAAPGLHAGIDGQYQSARYLFGDEANVTPPLPGFFVLNLHASYALTRWCDVFANAHNVLDRRYSTFGTFSPTSAVYLAQAPYATNPRAYTLAAPLGWFGGIKAMF